MVRQSLFGSFRSFPIWKELKSYNLNYGWKHERRISDIYDFRSTHTDIDLWKKPFVNIHVQNKYKMQIINKI